jgi:actin-related protein
MSTSTLRYRPDPQVRSVSFTPAPILALMAVGRTTGLVLDVGYRESTVVPVSPGWFLFRTTLVMFIQQSGTEL